MSATLLLEQMSVEEKLRAMETLWDGLCRQESGVPVPAWHHHLLDERERAVAEGRAKYTDWETARQEIMDRTA